MDAIECIEDNWPTAPPSSPVIHNPPLNDEIHNPFSSSFSAEVLASFIDPRQAFGLDKVIPPSVLANAKGLAIITVFKGGFSSFRYCNGFIVSRLADGSWSAPSVIGLEGTGFGAQIGLELTNFVFVLNDAALEAFSKKGSLTFGGNASLAFGPIGRNAEAIAESLKSVADVFNYSKINGLFVGVSVEGFAIVERKDANDKLYGHQYPANQLMKGIVQPPPAAASLMNILNSPVFAGVIGEYDSMYNEIDSYTRGDDDYPNRPRRGSTWADDIYDRPAQSMWR